MIRSLAWLVGIALLVLGVLTVHYTFGQPGSWEHHTEWAAANDMPPPSFELFVLGSTSTALGGGCLGFLVARRRRAA